MKRKVEYIAELLHDVYPQGLQDKDYKIWEKVNFEDRCNLFGMINLLVNTCDHTAVLGCGGFGFHPIQKSDAETLLCWCGAMQEILRGV